MDTRVTTVLKSHPYAYSPLEDVREPVCIEDIVLQMDALSGDNSDIEVCHKEADRLLVAAIKLLSERIDTDIRSDRDNLKALINSYYTVRKWYA